MSSLKDVIVRYWYGSSGDNEFQKKVYGGGKLRGQDKGRGVECSYLSIFTLMAMIDKFIGEFLFFHARAIELGKIDATMSDTPTTNTRR